MRNLKRALSLTLASVMLLGMMVVGSSAAGYDDVKETDNVEAIEVLQAIEVMVGDERGFGPERPVNRAEMAVVMGKLLNLDYNYYATSCPFNDVYDWARGYVGACYANKIVSGRGDGVYDPGATVTAVEAASMLMRALGYFRYQNDYEDGFVLATVKQGNKIGIFDNVGSSADAPMTRDQVAQIVLNALQCGVVEPDGNTTTFLNPDGTVLATTGKVNYVYVTSNKDYAKAISDVRASSIGSTNDSPIVELGEQLYNGDLKLYDNRTDEFGRPARRWEYDGKAIGTYMKKELLKEEYTVKVTGKMLYELLGKDVVDDYDFSIAIDGETTKEVLNAVSLAEKDQYFFTQTALNRTNTNQVGGTDKGVLTQVFVDGDKKEVYIAVINTYLAKAQDDYNAKKDEVTFEIWDVTRVTPGSAKALVKADDNVRNEKVSGEDFDIENIKADDIVLVRVAENEIQEIITPEIVDNTTISAFKNGSYVVADNTQYDYASTARYDNETLNNYSQDNMKDVTYNIILDKYGYLIGIELNEEVNQYAFLTGIDLGGSNLSAKNADANLIFLDGTMATVRVNTEKSELASKPADHNDDDGTDFTVTGGGAEFAGGARVNTWCTYTVDSNGIYTLKQVGDRSTARSATPAVRGAKKVAQSAMDMNDLTMAVKTANEVVINAKNVSLEGSKIRDDGSAITPTPGSAPYYNLLGDFDYVYGDDKTVYINVDLKNISDKNGTNATIVDKVASVSTGVKNVDITVTDLGDTTNHETFTAAPADEIYVLYGDNGYIIGVITLDAEDNGTTSSWAYITGSVNQEEYLGDSKWRWTREAIIDGRAVKLTEVDDDYDLLSPNKMSTGRWYELRFDADGNVTKLVPNNSPTVANRIDFTGITNDKFITDVQDVRAATNGINLGAGKNFDQNDSVLLYSDFTCNGGYDNHGAGNNVANLRYENGTLYTDNGTSRGFSVDPGVKVVVCLSNKHGSGEFDKIVDTYEGWDGLEDALKSLDCEKSAFDGYLSAVFSNGRATSIILDDRSGSHVAPIENAPKMTVNVTKIGPNSINLGSETIQWDGTAFDGSEVTTPTGYTWASATALTFVENGTGNTTFTYTGGPSGSMRVMVEFVTDLGDPGEAKVGQKAYTTVSDVNGDDIFTVADDLTIAAADYPTNYIAVTPANVSGDGGFFTAGSTLTVKVEVEAAVTIKVNGTAKTVAAAAKVGDTAVTGFGDNGFVYAATVADDGTAGYAKGSDTVTADMNYITTDKYVKLSVTTTSNTGITGKSTGTLTAAKTVKSGIVDTDYAKVGSSVTVTVKVTSSETGNDTLTGALNVAVANGGAGQATINKTAPTGTELIANGETIPVTAGKEVDVTFTVALPTSLTSLTADTSVTVTVS